MLLNVALRCATFSFRRSITIKDLQAKVNRTDLLIGITTLATTLDVDLSGEVDGFWERLAARHAAGF